jgi:hypothetical protein
MTCRGTTFALGLAAFGCSSSEPGTPTATGTPGGSSAVEMNQPSAGGAEPNPIASGAGGASSTEAMGALPLVPNPMPAVGAGGASAANPAVITDDYATDVNVSVHPDVNTVLVVTWNQAIAAENTFLEFTFEAGNVMRSRASAGTLGAHRDVVLGVPGATDVTVRVISQQAGTTYQSRDYTGTTLALPGGMPVPEILAYDATRASADRWLFGSVEDSDGGRAGSCCYYHTTFWLYIMDRQGRIVWYYADPASNATSSFQRIARDGEYIWIEKRPFGGGGERGVLKLTLDHAYSEEIAVPNLSDCIDVTTDGSLLYDAQNQLREMDANRQVRTIWSCRDEFGPNFQCYSNTINWNERDNTVFMSFPEHDTLVEIDRETGALVGQYGSEPGSWAFSPPTWGFGFQHFPNLSIDGTLMVSSHMPGFEDTFTPVANQHAFMEFEIDRANRVLIEKWVYTDGPEWAQAKGMAIRLANGNTLGNYGTGGVIREITPDKQTVFHVKFDVEGGDDFYNKMVGHNVFIDDLYALNGGPSAR